MNEKEWLASDDPQRMLAVVVDQTESGRPRITNRVSDRKLRLFACACCRASSSPIIRDRADRVESGKAGLPPEQHAANWCMPHIETVPASVRCALLRQIVGNPWRPWVVAQRGKDDKALREYQIFDLDWLTPTVLDLAARAYGGSGRTPFDASALPPLWDALETAGCQNEEMRRALLGEVPLPPGRWCQEHAADRRYYPCDEYDQCWCPSPVPAMRGHWVVDLVLEKY